MNPSSLGFTPSPKTLAMLARQLEMVLVDEPDLFTTERLMDGARAVLGTLWRQ